MLLFPLIKKQYCRIESYYHKHRDRSPSIPLSFLKMFNSRLKFVRCVSCRRSAEGFFVYVKLTITIIQFGLIAPEVRREINREPFMLSMINFSSVSHFRLAFFRENLFHFFFFCCSFYCCFVSREYFRLIFHCHAARRGRPLRRGRPPFPSFEFSISITMERLSAAQAPPEYQ